MLGHYLSTALRNMARRPVNTAIKLLALSLGLACLLTAHVIGDYFRQADRQWENADRIWLAVQEEERADGGWEASPDQRGSPAIAKYLRVDAPELEAVARMMLVPLPLRAPGQERAWTGGAVDPEFFDIFELNMAAGQGSLEHPHAVLIGTQAAESMFGGASAAIGQTVLFNDVLDLTVTGVFREFPEQSHLGAAGQKSIQVLHTMAAWDDAVQANNPQSWRATEQDNFQITGFITYALLPADGLFTAEALHHRLEGFADRHIPQGTLQTRVRAVPLLGLAETRFDRSIGLPMGLSVVKAFYVLGLLTLAVGCVNFANLAAAEAMTRAREIGLRKAVGAGRRQVAAQMLTEAGILAALALALVLPLSGIMASAISSRFYVSIPLPSLSRLNYWGGVVGILALVTAVAGLYPAWVLANLRPIQAMRSHGGRRGGAVRGALIGVQFAAAGLLLVIVAVMLAQNAGLRRILLQPGDDPVVFTSMPNPLFQAWDGTVEEARRETVRSRLLSHPAIMDAGFMVATPFYAQTYMISEFSQSLDLGAISFSGNARRADYDYFSVTRTPVLAGRVFERGADNLRKAVITEATARAMGMTPSEAIGQPIYRTASRELTAPEGRTTAPEHTIIGVVAREPLEFSSQGPANYIYVYELMPANYILVRVNQEDVASGVAHVERVWREFSPDGQARVEFLDEAFNWYFRVYRMVTFVFVALAAMAIAIAAMGLFGMASFVVQRRVREIGVRKVLGASTPRVLGMMLWDFSKPVIVANLIAWPVAWIAARAYLNLFVTRIELTVWPFLAALCVSLLTAWLAVGVHALRAASVKPALVLRAE